MSVKFGQFVYLGQDLEMARKILKERNGAFGRREYEANRQARFTPSGEPAPILGSSEELKLYGVDRQLATVNLKPMPVDYFMGSQDDKDSYDAITAVQGRIEFFNPKPMLGMNESRKPEHDQIDTLEDLVKKLVYGALESIAPATRIFLKAVPEEKE